MIFAGLSEELGKSFHDPSRVGALLRKGATANELLRATGIIGVGGTRVFVGGTLVFDGWGDKVAVAAEGELVGLDLIELLVTVDVAAGRVEGVSVTGDRMVGLKTVVCVRSTVGKTNGVDDLIGRLQAARTKISAIPSE